MIYRARYVSVPPWVVESKDSISVRLRVTRLPSQKCVTIAAMCAIRVRPSSVLTSAAETRLIRPAERLGNSPLGKWVHPEAPQGPSNDVWLTRLFGQRQHRKEHLRDLRRGPSTECLPRDARSCSELEFPIIALR